MKQGVNLLAAMFLVGAWPYLPAAAPKPGVKTAAEVEQDDGFRRRFIELSGNQAWEAFQGGTLFLDARPAQDFGYGHVPRAINLPFRAGDFEQRLAAFLKSRRIGPSSPLVVYCQGCCNTDSLYLALRLEEAGYAHVQIYRDGYPGWARASRPIERS